MNQKSDPLIQIQVPASDGSLLDKVFRHAADIMLTNTIVPIIAATPAGMLTNLNPVITASAAFGAVAGNMATKLYNNVRNIPTGQAGSNRIDGIYKGAVWGTVAGAALHFHNVIPRVMEWVR